MKGGTYVKKTNGSMCDELGDDEMMTAYVEEYGNTSACSIETKQGCDEREVAYIGKMSAKSLEDIEVQLKRLVGMEGNSMKPELLVWLKKRVKILKQLKAAQGEEL